MSDVVIALRGDESEKLINGIRAVVTPFVGISGEGYRAQLGIGLAISGNTAIFWGTIVPHSLIQSWRGMKILEQADSINSTETLCSCFTVAKNDINNATNHYIKSLARSFGGVDALQDIRYEILRSFPTADEITTMITKLREHNLPVDTREIEEAVNLNHIADTSVIREMIRTNRELFSRAVLNFA